MGFPLFLQFPNYRLIKMTDLSTQFEEVRLVYKNRTKANDRPNITCAEDAFKVFHQHWDKDQINLIEEAKILLLDNQLRVMSIAPLSKGGMTEAIVDPRMVFSIALKRRSHRIILAHNHPSGTLKPSQADINLTKRLEKLGQMMKIPLEDHLIITEHGFRSVLNDSCGGLEHG